MSEENQSNLPAVIQAAVTNQKIDLSKVTLLMPTQTFGQIIGEYDKVILEVIKINPDPESGDVYEVAKGKLALSKRPLGMISSALGIIWDPVTTGIVESVDRKSRAKATGALRMPNGEWIPTTEEKTVDLDAIEEEQRIKQEEYADEGCIVKWETSKNGKKYPIHEPWSNHGGEAAKQAYIDREIRKAVLPYRKFKDERANTGAKERVIKWLVDLKNTYTSEELSKPIAFPRIVTDTSKLLADPVTRQIAIDKMTGAVRSIFGRGAEVEIVKPLEHKSQYQIESNGETLEEEIPFDELPEPEPEKDEIEKGITYLLELVKIKYLHKEARAIALEEINRGEHTLDTVNGLIERIESWLSNPETEKKYGKFASMRGVIS